MVDDVECTYFMHDDVDESMLNEFGIPHFYVRSFIKHFAVLM